MPPESDAPDPTHPAGTPTARWSDLPGSPPAGATGGVGTLAGLPARYELRGWLGTGGTAEVSRVWDRLLDRPLALKVLRVERDSEGLRERFLAEARLTARLQHPGIVPVHDQGVLDDGRLWFTMREVRGRTLGAVHADVRANGGDDGNGWTLRRLLGAFEQAARIVAYAHAEGVAHLDLKPENLLIGPFGEVQVIDWGLGLAVATESDPDAAAGGRGIIAGTPGYMAPEQARGDHPRIGLAADVHALGATLLQLLTGAPAYPYGDAGWRATRLGARRPTTEAELQLPDSVDLLALAIAATDPEPHVRPDIQALVARAGAWLEGSHRRDRALATVASTAGLATEIHTLRTRAHAGREAGVRLLAGVPREAPEARKWPGWEVLDEANTLEQAAEVQEARWLRGMHGALELAPDLPEAHDPLAAYWKAQVHEAEARGDTLAAARGEVWLAAHDRGQHHAWRRGEGTLTLHTDPPDAEVTLHRVHEVHRRYERAPEVQRLRTPLEAIPLPHGSWNLEIRAPGCATVQLPVHLGRLEHWANVPPGALAPHPLRLPRHDELADDECFVPGGWFRCGGDAEATDPLPTQSVWIPPFVMTRHVVTWGGVLAFLDDLARRGDTDALASALPRAPASSARAGEPLVIVEAGEHRLALDPGGPAPALDHPATLLDWYAARAYARWRSERTALAWRLPHELEWEKAGRGADGRRFPWGDTFDPSRACCSHSFTGPPHPTPVTDFPSDESPYGVRGLSGNVREWCLNVWTRSVPEALTIVDPASDEDWRTVRGGAFTTTPAQCRLASRYAARPHERLSTVGFRLVRGVPETAGLPSAARLAHPVHAPARSPGSG